MKNVSYKFKEIIHNGGPFYAYAKVVLADGQELEFDSENDFLMDGNGYSESGGVSSFPLGVAVAKAITLNLDNSDEKYSEYDFYYARITLYTEAELDNGTTERIKEGTFTVTSPVAIGDIIEIEAINDMYKANITYVPNVSLPTTLLQIAQDVCSQCGILLGSPSFTNQDFTVKTIKEGMTCREVLGYIAQIAGGNALCDENNRLLIRTYDLSVFEQRKIISGENLRKEVQDRISGENFGENISDTVQGGTFGENDNFHVLASFQQNPEISTDDVVITGLATTYKTEVNEEEQEVEYLYGEEGYVLSIDNPLIEGKEQEALQKIGTWIIGISVRPFSAQHTSYPIAEFMDPVYVVDTKNNVYESFLTDIEYEYLSNTTLSNSTESPARNNSEYYSQASAAYRKAREELQNQKSEWEKAMEDLSNRLDNSSGLFMTAEKQSDGSSIYYMHNKPTKEESSIIWKMTAEAMAVSTDGGKTWNAGMTVDGDTIVRILSAVGVNADWIKSGTMEADRIMGGSLKLGGKNNAYGILLMLNGSGKVIGNWSSDSLILGSSDVLSYAALTLLSSDAGYTKFYPSSIYIYDKNDYVGVGIYGNASSRFGHGLYIEEEITAFCDGDVYVSGDSNVTLRGASGVNISGKLNCYPYDIESGSIAAKGKTSEFTSIEASIGIESASIKGNYLESNMLIVTGTKSKLVDSENYGGRILHCYETATPYFGDIGNGYLNENGECRIYIEDVFSEVISIGCEYQVFLQKEGQGDIWVDEKESTYFKVSGTPGLRFAWEMKAIQKGFEARRLDRIETEAQRTTDIDYAELGAFCYKEEQNNKFASESQTFYKEYSEDIRRKYYA